LALSLHSSNEPGELSQWLCHDDSTINIILVIINTNRRILYVYFTQVSLKSDIHACVANDALVLAKNGLCFERL